MLVTGVRTLVKVMIMIIVGHSSGTFAIYSFVFCCQQKRIEGKRSCVCHTGQCPTALSVCLSHTVQCPTALSVCLSHHVSVRVSVPPCIYWLSSLVPTLLFPTLCSGTLSDPAPPSQQLLAVGPESLRVGLPRKSAGYTRSEGNRQYNRQCPPGAIGNANRQYNRQLYEKMHFTKVAFLIKYEMK